jgi:UDP-N-acetylglucosamine 2-epimerase (non-hydrolysing)
LKKVLFIFGTRPEGIKLAPLIRELQKTPSFQIRICTTDQHQQMLNQVLTFFKIVPDYRLNLLKQNQTLVDLTDHALTGITDVVKVYKPDLVVVQGDTTTALAGTLAAYYQKIPVAHVEAGLRTHNKYAPFPEEINRTVIDHIADYLFTPTRQARENLFQEGLRHNVYVVGNTVIDALLLGTKILRKSENEDKFYKFFHKIDFSKQIILVTCHRRESFGKPLENIAHALLRIANISGNIEIVYPLHLNPNVQKPMRNLLMNQRNIHLIEPLDYPHLIWLMIKSRLILTDSGGIQEEAPTLSKPVLVMREVTERTEGIEAGTAKLVGTNLTKIVKVTMNILNNKHTYTKMAKAINPYGDGKSSKRIVKILKEVVSKKLL